MSSVHNQQPIHLTVGRRRARDAGMPDARVRALMAQMARYRTRAPKGVFVYRSHEEMEADRVRWLVQAMIEKATRR
jgi:hypothetical protein